jgi:hypothetical protein
MVEGTAIHARLVQQSHHDAAPLGVTEQPTKILQLFTSAIARPCLVGFGVALLALQVCRVVVSSHGRMVMRVF